MAKKRGVRERAGRATPTLAEFTRREERAAAEKELADRPRQVQKPFLTDEQRARIAEGTETLKDIKRREKIELRKRLTRQRRGFAVMEESRAEAKRQQRLEEDAEQVGLAIGAAQGAAELPREEEIGLRRIPLPQIPRQIARNIQFGQAYFSTLSAIERQRGKGAQGIAGGIKFTGANFLKSVNDLQDEFGIPRDQAIAQTLQDFARASGEGVGLSKSATEAWATETKKSVVQRTGRRLSNAARSAIDREMARLQREGPRLPPLGARQRETQLIEGMVFPKRMTNEQMAQVRGFQIAFKSLPTKIGNRKYEFNFASRTWQDIGPWEVEPDGEIKSIGGRLWTRQGGKRVPLLDTQGNQISDLSQLQTVIGPDGSINFIDKITRRTYTSPDKLPVKPSRIAIETRDEFDEETGGRVTIRTLADPDNPDVPVITTYTFHGRKPIGKLTLPSLKRPGFETLHLFNPNTKVMEDTGIVLDRRIGAIVQIRDEEGVSHPYLRMLTEDDRWMLEAIEEPPDFEDKSVDQLVEYAQNADHNQLYRNDAVAELESLFRNKQNLAAREALKKHFGGSRSEKSTTYIGLLKEQALAGDPMARDYLDRENINWRD